MAPPISADTYADRTLFETNDDKVDVLLPNRRRDAVNRLLQGGAYRAVESPHADDFPMPAPRQWRCLNCLNDPAGRIDELIPVGGSKERSRKPFLSLASTGTVAGRIDEDSFTYLRELGKGTFGSVYLVKHKQKGTTHAMKVLHKRTFWTPRHSNLRYALTERDVLCFAKHPYIVSLDFAFQTAKELVLVMQYCPGGHLKHVVRKSALGRLQQPLARQYTAEVFLGLEYLHERQIIHRDLKPENVILDIEGHCLLADFGLSKERVRRSFGTSSMVGSMTYMAPEVFQQRRQHNHTVDLWAMGVILFEMLTGRPPFYGGDREKMKTKIASADLDFTPHPYVSLSAESLIRQLRMRDPLRRLGANNTADVRLHVFLTPIDFDALLKREVPVPQPVEPSARHAEVAVDAMDDVPIPTPFQEGWRSKMRNVCRRFQRANSVEPPRVCDWSCDLVGVR